MPDPFLLHMPHWPTLLGPEPSGTPSARARTLLAKLGHPEKRLPPVVHVGGTKGKGSTIAFLRAMLEAAGYRVHAYTSPHMARFNERIVLAGREIDDDGLHEIIERARRAAGDMPVGFFDATTAAAMLAFSEVPADILLMEMGLGGSVDATNIIDHPRLTIMTTISYDHMEHMGTTLTSIASFEAGLLKPGVPCVVSYQHAEVLPVLEQAAEGLHAPLHSYARHWQTRRGAAGMVFADMHGEATLPLPSLLGMHQIVNAGNAIAAISVLDEFNVEPEHVVAGLTHAQWKGRLTKLAPVLFPEGSELWFDGGHNSAAAEVVAFFVSEQWQDKPFYLIFGTSQSKDAAAMLSPFAELSKRIYSVNVKSEPGSYSAETISTLAGQEGMQIKPMQSIEATLDDIRAQEPAPFRVLIFGSLYLWLESVTV